MLCDHGMGFLVSVFPCQLDDLILFVGQSQYLKMYSQYCSNQNASNRMFNHLTKHNKAFEELARDLSRHPDCRLLDLPAYLIKPMQRVCKYPLLLREIVKHTPDSHSDYQTLQEALQLISSTVLVGVSLLLSPLIGWSPHLLT